MKSTLQEIEETMARLWTQPAENQTIEVNPEYLPQGFLEGLQPTQELYRRHIFNKRLEFTSSCYPLCSRLLKDRFKQLAGEYWATEQAGQRDVVAALSGFPTFLRHGHPDLIEEFPFLAELADFELTKSLVQQSDQLRIARNFNPFKVLKLQSELFPLVNQTLKLRAYQYQISSIAHEIDHKRLLKIREIEKQSTILAIYQDPHSQEVKVQQLGDVAAFILSDARLQQITFAELARTALIRLNDPKSIELHKLVFETFTRLNEVGLFVGTGRQNDTLQLS